MPELATGLMVVYLAVAFGLRTVVQLRRTGSSGFHGISGRAPSAEWFGGVAFIVALVLAVVAPVLGRLSVLDPINALNGSVGHVAGGVLAVAGLVATFAAQVAMGESWRIGVDEHERTALVTTGPFALVRNPIFAAMIPTGLGLALLVPNVAAVLGFVALVLALELQTRVVEEPYLLRTHGDDYSRYAARVGRFLPGVGRLRS